MHIVACQDSYLCTHTYMHIHTHACIHAYVHAHWCKSRKEMARAGVIKADTKAKVLDIKSP